MTRKQNIGYGIYTDTGTGCQTYNMSIGNVSWFGCHNFKML